MPENYLKKVVYLTQQKWYEMRDAGELDKNTIYITPTDNYGGVIGRQGDKGDKGDKGDSVKGDKGDKGDRGEAAFEMEIADVITLLPGQAAYMMNIGTKELQRYAVGIPTGQRGIQGMQGDKGDPGKDGGGMVEWDSLELKTDGFSVTVAGEIFSFDTEYDPEGRIAAISGGGKRRVIAYE